MQVQPVARHKPEGRTNLSRYHEAALLTENQCGIHSSIMPHTWNPCHAA